MSNVLKIMIVVLIASLACGRAAERTERTAAPAESRGVPPSPAETAEPVDPVAARVQDLDSRLQTLQATEGDLEWRGTAARYRAYWDQGAVVVFDEELSLTDGTKKARYYYNERGSMIEYREESTQKDEADPSQSVPVELRMTFDPSGEMKDGSKTAGGMSHELADFEINGARERSRQLLTLITISTSR